MNRDETLTPQGKATRADRPIVVTRDMTPDYEREMAKDAARTLGSIKTKKKAKASRENGRKGGRPKLQKNTLGLDVRER